ncbi:MAG: hypothetical protein HY721_11665 [Planctomycetes bacterium]|nr:hypothetical protein [Planctomycetota bacterium]
MTVSTQEGDDACFTGSCPELFYGGCHGGDAKSVFAELCEIIEETIQLYEQDGKPLPPPISGPALVNAMQRVA